MKKNQYIKKELTRLSLASLAMTIILVISGLCFNMSAKVSAASATEYAMFPNGIVNVSQTAYGGYSHGKKQATDIIPVGRLKAPVSGTIRFIDKKEGNTVILESDNPVLYADGRVAKICIGFTHDNNISDLWVGKHLNQGEEFYDKGTKSGSSAYKITGAHVHIFVISGAYSKNMYKYDGNTYIYSALWLTPNTRIAKSGYSPNLWHRLSKTAVYTPSRVAGVKVTTTKTNISLSWKKVSGNNIKYEIWDNVHLVTTVSGITFKHTGLKKKSLHTYQIRAFYDFFGWKVYGPYSYGYAVITNK